MPKPESHFHFSTISFTSQTLHAHVCLLNILENTNTSQKEAQNFFVHSQHWYECGRPMKHWHFIKSECVAFSFNNIQN